MTEHIDRYHADSRGDNPVKGEVARRQLRRLVTKPSGRTREPAIQTRWAHVPLGELFAGQGNLLRVRPDGTVEAGHEPLHSSRSGRCVLIDPARGRWWCRSCRRSGDAAGFVMDARGCSYREAAAWLTARYDPRPAPRAHRPRVRWLDG